MENPAEAMSRSTTTSCLLLLLSSTNLLAAEPLLVASRGKVTPTIAVFAKAGPFEKRAADDLAKYIEKMTRVRPTLANSDADIGRAKSSKTPVLVLGQVALQWQPTLRKSLGAVVKKKPMFRTDGVVLRREGNRVYVAGNNDRSHYFAVAELLRRWGCRWYTPTDFGECIPELTKLEVGELDYAYSSPFEVRTYWISWNGDNTGAADFRLRNMMTDRRELPPTGHALGKYTKGLGKGTFHFPITAPATATHVASKVEKMYAEGKSFSLGMEDGSYDSDYAGDQKLMKLQWDKYFMRWSVTDPMLELYNNVAKILQKKHPKSDAKIGFLAYANMTLPPVRAMTAEPSLFCELAPIDIDPIHGMDDVQSPPRREYRDMLVAWAKVMQGRLCIYDYDQGMLVWRDIPNPSHQAFRQDVQHYRRTGILGVNTESRNAIATTFLNLHMRARLLWNPDENVEALLDEFYPKFYGPAAEPMKKYWSAIYAAWDKTIVTEHEHFVAPAIYTRDLVEQLRKHLREAESIINGVQVVGRPLTDNEKLYVRRMEFTRLSFSILDAYMKMVWAAASDVDYAAAVRAGERGLKARQEMANLAGIFTTTKLEGKGYPWWPGEVRQYRELLPFVDGTKGTLIAKLPTVWALRRDPKQMGETKNFVTAPVDLTYWNANKDELTLDSRKDYPDQWEEIRTDLYAQAQGVRHPDRQSYLGDLWYRTEITLSEEQTQGDVRLRFPGLFNECWLFVNGKEVAHREQGKLWWRNDYRFEWDVELKGKLKAGKNTIAIRCRCEHHFGGIFRRPFLYRSR